MFDVVGYALIKKDAKSGVSPNPISEFTGHRVRVMEFSKHDGSVLVVNSQGTALASFDKEDVLAKFECRVVNDVIVPPHLNAWEAMMYASERSMRKGGYPNIVKEMVIAASMHKGEVNDNFLFQKEREEAARKEREAAPRAAPTNDQQENKQESNT